MDITDEIVALEWAAFDKVHNEGGRANCQEDFGTFEIMRKSQFLAWNDSTREGYLADLRNAARRGRNLVQEKYARMMASTAPEQYAAFAHTLPPLPESQRADIEQIIAQQLEWRLAFAAQYPHMSGQARLIRTEEDTAFDTSFETYLRGELGTYSGMTLSAYKRMVAAMAAAGENLTTRTMEHTARLYGYADLADAEAKLARA